ncbi:MAG: NitT/TauT family transport system ATP-binding protein [Paraburkholderia sp.]|jgi:NitT/TauT family transport system ATP-binding protein|uniref:ABC transporter ATP-binding protein n=1 Tax=Paraburkholderia sp. TaxID=1926495 RepID=UPI002AFE7478|nr:ABC transporter ATP-binding protein [Paraburkholderia sp.]MEA3088367.1 NitT/TauT family transport system ATP-binding protein [Paraburkholderia sp.]
MATPLVSSPSSGEPAHLPPPASQSYDAAYEDANAKIRLRHLTKSFQTQGGLVTALNDVSLDIPSGCFFMIVGPSGCGKTTLLRILANLETPTSGSVEITAPAEFRPGNSMVFQGDSLFPWMTVYDNAAYGLALRHVPKAEIRDVVGHYLSRTGLTRFAKAYPHQLSGGMRQRVSIVRAFANDPDILLMDEPFSALDEQNKLLLQEELLRIWEETRKTVLFITHSVDEAVTLGDRIMVMTAQPGSAKQIVDVPFERPRSVLELRARPEYGEFVYSIWGQLRDEVERARARDLGGKQS